MGNNTSLNFLTSKAFVIMFILRGCWKVFWGSLGAFGGGGFDGKNVRCCGETTGSFHSLRDTEVSVVRLFSFRFGFLFIYHLYHLIIYHLSYLQNQDLSFVQVMN